MIVIDASAMVEILLKTARGQGIAHRLLHGPALRLHAPHLLDVEVIQVFRRYVRDGEVPAERALSAFENLRDFPLRRHAPLPLLFRAWDRRENLSAYDAMYVALAEALGAVLVTCDGRLARAPLSGIEIELYD